MEPLDQHPDEDKGISPALLRDWREIPSEAVERAEVRNLIRLAVEQLPDIYRQVFLMRDVEELTINETAEALNIRIPSVKVRLHRARMMLQKQLAPQLRTVNRTFRGGDPDTSKQSFRLEEYRRTLFACRHSPPQPRRHGCVLQLQFRA